MIAKYRMEGEIIVVYPMVNLVLDEVYKFKSYTTSLHAEASFKALCVNMEHVKSIDSNGIGVIVGLLKKCKENHIQFILCNANARIKEVFKMIGLHRLVTMNETEHDALETLKSQVPNQE